MGVNLEISMLILKTQERMGSPGPEYEREQEQRLSGPLVIVCQGCEEGPETELQDEQGKTQESRGSGFRNQANPWSEEGAGCFCS